MLRIVCTKANSPCKLRLSASKIMPIRCNYSGQKPPIPDVGQGLRDQDSDKKLKKMQKEAANQWPQREDKRPGYDDLAPKSVEFSKRAKHNRGDKSLPGNTEYENYSVADKDRVETEAMSSDVSGMSKEGEGLRYDSPSDPKIKSNKPKERRMGEINQPGGFA